MLLRPRFEHLIDYFDELRLICRSRPLQLPVQPDVSKLSFDRIIVHRVHVLYGIVRRVLVDDIEIVFPGLCVQLVHLRLHGLIPFFPL